MWASVVGFFSTAFVGITKITKVFTLISKLREMKKEGVEAFVATKEVFDKSDDVFESLKDARENGATREELIAVIDNVYGWKKEFDEARKEVNDVIELIKEW